MKAPAPPRFLVPALAAAAGLVVAHAVDYVVLYPSSGERDAYLHATGHGYWSLAVALATGAAALAVLLVAASAAIRAGRGGAARVPAPAGPRARLGPLVAWQMAAFVALEAGERGLAGLSADSVLHGWGLWLGLALQVPVAWLMVRLLRGVDRTAEAVAARLRAVRTRRRGPRARLVPPVLAAPPRLRLAAPGRPRAPPG